MEENVGRNETTGWKTTGSLWFDGMDEEVTHNGHGGGTHQKKFTAVSG